MQITSLILVSLILVPAFGFTISCGSPGVDTKLFVFSAAGSKPAVDRICQEFQKKYGTTIEVSYGGGGEVLSQMTLSRNGDIYIAPEQKFMEAAREKQAVLPETIQTVAYMVPVIAVQKGNPGNIQCLGDLAGTGIRIAVTREETTLLGKYAPEIFTRAGLYEEIKQNIIAEVARPDNLLTMLVMGQIDAAIIWHFYEVQAPDRIENVYLSPEQLTGIGEMQMGVSAFSLDEKSANRFIEFVTSNEGKEILGEAGYFVNREEVIEYLP